MSRKSKFKRLSVRSLVLLSLLASTAPVHTYADGSNIADQTPYEIPSVGSVWLNDKSYFELKDVRLTMGADNKVVTFTVKVANGGTSDIQFIDYWVKLQSSTGANFTVNLMPQDKDKNVVPAGGSQEIKFYANVTPAIHLSDLEFKFIKWDFTAADFQRTLDTLKVPSDYSTIVPAGSKANLKIAKTSLTGFIKKATTSSNEEHYLPILLLELQNTDTRSVKLPNLKFTIRTADGLLYPLQATGVNENTTIDPLMKKEIALTGKLPRSIQESGWQLVVTETTDTGTTANLNVAVAEFEIPKPTEDQLATEKEQSFSNASGTYMAKLESIQRVPWEDEDLLTAAISLKSNESKALPIPELTGYIKLDDSVKVDVKVIKTDNVIGIQPGKEVHILLQGKIPYTYEFSNVTIFLQEKESSSGSAGSSGTSGNVADLVQFKINSNLDSVPLVNSGEHFKLGGIGRSGDYTIHALHNFGGKSSDIITAQIEVENLEKRANELSKLVAHFKGSDGTVYPASISEIKTKISPSGKALLHVWANVAKSKTKEITQLIIGEGITEGKFTEGEGKPDAYVNAVSFVLPQQNNNVSNSIKNIDLFPYKLSLSRVGTSVQIQGSSNSTVKISFDYELDKDDRYEVNTDEYKLLLEMEDTKGSATLAHEFSIEKKSQTSDGKSNQDNADLELGKNKMEVTITDSDFIYKTQSLQKYKLNIYQLFQGQKKLIASKELDWFVYSD